MPTKKERKQAKAHNQKILDDAQKDKVIASGVEFLKKNDNHATFSVLNSQMLSRVETIQKRIIQAVGDIDRRLRVIESAINDAQKAKAEKEKNSGIVLIN